MTLNPADMLRRLAAGIGPAAGARPVTPVAPARSATGLEKLGFADLLNKARAGELQTSLPVTVDEGVGAELSADQLARLAKAADRAEAAGLATALVQLDGQNLLLDVQQRRVTGVVDSTRSVASGIDGVIVAESAMPADGQPAALAQLPRASLLKLLDRPSSRPGAAA